MLQHHYPARSFIHKSIYQKISKKNQKKKKPRKTKKNSGTKKTTYSYTIFISALFVSGVIIYQRAMFCSKSFSASSSSSFWELRISNSVSIGNDIRGRKRIIYMNCKSNVATARDIALSSQFCVLMCLGIFFRTEPQKCNCKKLRDFDRWIKERKDLWSFRVLSVVGWDAESGKNIHVFEYKLLATWGPMSLLLYIHLFSN